MDRPLRVAGLGWDLIAPGALANGGMKPGPESAFTKAGLAVELEVLDSMKKVEEALARGGGDSAGADVAVLPMPAYVAAFERLRALDPKVFFVVGWSKGREALYAKEATLTKEPTGPVTLLAQQGSAQSFMGLFLLDLAGVEPSKVKLLDTADKKSAPTFEAVELAGDQALDPQRGTLLLTTADVPRLVPLVAVAQGGFVVQHTEALAAWARTWLDGEERIQKDAAASARAIAKYEGAPDPLVLINRLGPVGWASLADNARWLGLAGRGAVTLETLFQRAWMLWRESGLLSTPRPESPSAAPAVVASLVRRHGVTDEPKGSMKKGQDGEPERVLLVHVAQGDKLDSDAFTAEVGLLAGLFERSTLRISVRGPRHQREASQLVEAAAGRYGLDAARLTVSDKPATRAVGVVEVMAPR